MYFGFVGIETYESLVKSIYILIFVQCVKLTLETLNEVGDGYDRSAGCLRGGWDRPGLCGPN